MPGPLRFNDMTGRHGGKQSTANASACSACSTFCTYWGHAPVSLDEANDLIHEHTISLDDPASTLSHRYLERRRACRGLLNQWVVCSDALLDLTNYLILIDSTTKSGMAAGVPSVRPQAVLVPRNGRRKVHFAHIRCLVHEL